MGMGRVNLEDLYQIENTEIDIDVSFKDANATVRMAVGHAKKVLPEPLMVLPDFSILNRACSRT